MSIAQASGGKTKYKPVYTKRPGQEAPQTTKVSPRQLAAAMMKAK